MYTYSHVCGCDRQHRCWARPIGVVAITNQLSHCLCPVCRSIEHYSNSTVNAPPLHEVRGLRKHPQRHCFPPASEWWILPRDIIKSDTRGLRRLTNAALRRVQVGWLISHLTKVGGCSQRGWGAGRGGGRQKGDGVIPKFCSGVWRCTIEARGGQRGKRGEGRVSEGEWERVRDVKMEWKRVQGNGP